MNVLKTVDLGALHAHLPPQDNAADYDQGQHQGQAHQHTRVETGPSLKYGVTSDEELTYMST